MTPYIANSSNWTTSLRHLEGSWVWPTDRREGDLLVFVLGNTNPGAPTAAAGWTEQAATSRANQLQRIYTIVRGASDPANDFDMGASANACLVVMVVRGFNAVTAVDTSSAANTGAGPTTDVTATGVTTAENDELLITSHSVNDNGSFTPPSGMTELVDINIGTSMCLEVNYVLQSAKGASGNKTATHSASSSKSRAACLLAIKPRTENVFLFRGIG